VRQSLIRPDFKEELQKYITGIVRKKGQKLIEINSMPDHTHMLIGLRRAMSIDTKWNQTALRQEGNV
jgi:REP element-mobilizing transposase RayT